MVKITFDDKGFKKAMTALPKQLFVGMQMAFQDVAGNYLNRLTKERLSGAGENSLGRRTGDLARSFGRTIQGQGIKLLTLVIYTNSKYAPIHEYGGTIKPKKSKYLAIPLNAAKTFAGASRAPSPRDYDLKYGGRSKKGNIILRTLDGTPMFVLVKSVYIKPRLGMAKTWTAQERSNIRRLNRSVTDTINQNNNSKATEP